MPSSYEIRRARRERERQRRLCGETLDAFHAREAPAPTVPGADIAHARCRRTTDLFDMATDRERARGPSFFSLWTKR